jgi:hypothetical protein
MLDLWFKRGLNPLERSLSQWYYTGPEARAEEVLVVLQELLARAEVAEVAEHGTKFFIPQICSRRHCTSL